MSTVISRRSFLKCTGASAAVLGAASLLGGCKSNGNDTVVEVKVGDTVAIEVDQTKKLASARNHTATHLLQAALAVHFMTPASTAVATTITQ